VPEEEKILAIRPISLCENHNDDQNCLKDVVEVKFRFRFDINFQTFFVPVDEDVF
jgi:hypothetical protein